MSKDVFGRKPVSKAGIYFRVSHWQWHALLERIDELCGDFIGSEALLALAENDGAGPRGPELCRQMAERFESWLQSSDFVDEVTVGSTLVTPAEEPDSPAKLREQGYTVAVLGPCPLRDFVERWIDFLRHCGGFEVW